MRDTERPFYLPELDIMRAFAFLGVFCSHWIPSRLGYYAEHHVPGLVAHAMKAVSGAGADGVMLFFCLSSYLITRLLQKELGKYGSIDVGAFYMRRVLRIWPLYMTFTVAAALVQFVDPEQGFSAKACAAFFLFSGNWVLSLGGSITSIVVPLWSVSVEEQFYLVWPWLVRRATREGLKRTAIGLFVLALANRALIVSHLINADLWHSTFNQLDSIAFGALLALGSSERLEALRERARGRILGAALATLVLAQFLRGPVEASWQSLVFFPLVSLCCAVILFSVIGVRVDARSAAMRALLQLGKISYGLYVVHMFSFYLVNKLFRAAPPRTSFLVGFGLRGVAALSLTVVLAAISYRWLEKPFLGFKGRFETSPRPASAGANDSSAVGSGAFGAVTDLAS